MSAGGLTMTRLPVALFFVAVLAASAAAGPGKYNKVLAPGDKAPA